MFTAPARKLLNTLANVVVFTDPKAEDPRAQLAGVRIRVSGDVLDATATDAYVIGQGRIFGSADGSDWSVLVDASDLKPVIAALKKIKDGTAGVELTGGVVFFTVGGETFEVFQMEGLESCRGYDSMFNYTSGHDRTPGFAVFSASVLAKLGKLKDYDAATTRFERHSANAVAIGLNAFESKPAMATFGDDFRLVVMPVRSNSIPTELADMGGDSWLFRTAA